MTKRAVRDAAKQLDSKSNGDEEETRALAELLRQSLSKNPALAEKQRRLLEKLIADPGRER